MLKLESPEQETLSRAVDFLKKAREVHQGKSSQRKAS